MIDRNSIKRRTYEGGKSVTSFRIFHPVDSKIRDFPISKTIMKRDVVTDYDAVEALRAAVLQSSTEELELARPAILFHLLELQDFIINTALNIQIEGIVKATPKDTISSILNGVVNDASKLLTAIDKAPRTQRLHSALQGSMSYLGEIVSLTALVAELQDEGFEPLSQKAAQAFLRLSERLRKLKAQTSERYPEISVNIADPADILKDADIRVRTADLTIPDVSAERITQLSFVAGNRDILWNVAQKDEWRQDYIDKGLYKPLTERSAESFRGEVIALLDDINATFNGGGLINELRMIPAALRHAAQKSVQFADGYDERRITNQRVSRFKDQQERVVKDEIARLPMTRFVARSRATSEFAQAELLSSFINQIGKALNPDVEPSSRLHFARHDSGALVGTLDRQWDYAIVIYRDKGVSARDAVYVSRLPLDLVENGLPDLATARDHPLHIGMNYHSVDDALIRLSHDEESMFYFQGIVINGNDGFKIIEEERKYILRVIRDGGRTIADFSDYDHSHALSHQSSVENRRY